MNKFKYYVKRFGFIGIIKQALSKFGLINFDVYNFLYERYYSKLKKEDFEDELIDWYKYRSLSDRNALENPKTFNEKIQWLKINDATKLKTICADKYAVRGYIEEKVGKEYLIPLLGCWNKFEDINFSKLPDKMIFKSTTGSARYKIIKDKKNIDYEDLKKSMDSWQKLPYGYAGMEIHYLDIERKIICEKLLDMDGPSVVDYKIHCFNGKPIIVEYISDRKNHSYRESWFDTKWNKLNIVMDSDSALNHEIPPNPPEKLEKMIEISKILSEDFIYVRVDLYEIDGKIYFGELTFTPANGFDEWKGRKSQLLVGKLLRLPYEERLDIEEINKIMSDLKE
ncbi:hypothetical protein HMPREF3224_01834 [Anaerococcus hydrogenalis]|nr:hypothetical protein HMPREF3224_01834 [Anaerococcus hydrogenalis]